MQPAVLQRYYRFESYWEFEIFNTLLTQQLAANQLVAIPAPAETEQPLPYRASSYYQVSSSQQIWALATPDNALRGYFLPLAEALAYQRKLNDNDRRRKWGCLLLVVLAVGIYFGWLIFR